jgi:hypothetical protein
VPVLLGDRLSECGEEVYGITIRILDDCVALTPHSIPWRDVTLAADCNKFCVRRIDCLCVWVLERDREPVVAASWRLPIRVEGPHRLSRIPGKPQATRKGDFHMWRPVGFSGDFESEAPVKRKGLGQVVGNDSEHRDPCRCALA